jgi:hypothetical protein
LESKVGKRDRGRERRRILLVKPLTQTSLFGKVSLIGPAAILSALMLLAFACGKKGNPRAPELSVPRTIKDLKAEARTKGVTLSWSRPTEYVDGKELRDLVGFVIFRKELPATCPECTVPYRERASVSVEDQEKFVKTKKFGFIDSEVNPQRIYRYRVFSQLRDGSLSDPSNEVEVAWRP